MRIRPLLAVVAPLVLAGAACSPSTDHASQEPAAPSGEVAAPMPGRPDAAVPRAEGGPNAPDMAAATNSPRPDGGATPAATSDAGLSDELRVSPGRGFYEAPLNVTLSAPAGTTVRYTLDGSAPTATNGQVYGAPLAVKQTTVLRVAAFQGTMPVGKPTTHTYLFLEDVLHQSADGQPPAGWPATWGANKVDYGMDARIVTSPRYAARIKNDLQSIPTISVVMALPDLFDAKTGIYANAKNDGRMWERPGSLELIFPDGKPGFQIDAGFRIRGGVSRGSGNPKHSFRVFFRKEYGAGQLKYPLFGDAGAKSFDKIDLRAPQNYTWHLDGDKRSVFVRDVFSADTQLAMGQQGERARFHHLYINGQYWGLYNTVERPEAAYAATYWGGTEDDWDVVKPGPGQNMTATDGDLMAWTRLWSAVKMGPVDDNLITKLAGRKLDAPAESAQDPLLDLDNMIDYMLVIFYAGNFDAPVSRFYGENLPNNVYALRSRTGMTTGFRFVLHDSENSLLDVNENRVSITPGGDAKAEVGNPQWFFYKLRSNATFKRKVVERVQKHFFGSGALTVDAVLARFRTRRQEIDRAVVAESARWGDAHAKGKEMPFNRDDHWVPEMDKLESDYFPKRRDVVLGQLKALGLAP